VLIYSVLDGDRDVREQQLLLVAQRMGADSEARVRALLEAGPVPAPNRRLPLMELAFPALKRRPPAFLAGVLALLQDLAKLDGRIEVFEYLLVKVLAQYLWESQNPHLARNAGNLALADCRPEIARVLAVLAVHGQESCASAEAAFRAGMQGLADGGDFGMPEIAYWITTLDADLPRLDQLSAKEKQHFTGALLRTVTFDGSAVPAELEMLRVICALVHVPLPMLTGNAANPA